MFYKLIKSLDFLFPHYFLYIRLTRYLLKQIHYDQQLNR